MRRRRSFAQRGAIVGAVVVLAIVVLAIVQPGADPYAIDVDHGLTALGAPLPPSAHAPLGTDALGRDVWARVVAGAGSSLSIAALATALALVVGVAVGLVAGYAGGWVDNLLMRTVDLVLAFPFLLLAILLAALLRNTSAGASIAPVIAALAIASWTTMARVVRSRTLALTRSEMVIAARALGATPARIVMRYLLPNVAGLVVVIAALAFAQNLLAESVLSYLGLGAPPPAASWGRMLYEGRVYYRSAPHLVVVPGLAIVVAVAAFHLIGEGLRAWIDPGERA
ncbi:MAG TPA: ABC transporter permease [Kofleriaceae bacterium]|nr:ABC transporter permease [Kofleriaceae bacterium]